MSHKRDVGTLDGSGSRLEEVVWSSTSDDWLAATWSWIELGTNNRHTNAMHVDHTVSTVCKKSLSLNQANVLSTEVITNWSQAVSKGGGLANPLVTHGPCLTSRCCPLWQLIRPIIAVLHDSLMCGWVVCLDYNKDSLLLLLLWSAFTEKVTRCL